MNASVKIGKNDYRLLEFIGTGMIIDALINEPINYKGRVKIGERENKCGGDKNEYYKESLYRLTSGEIIAVGAGGSASHYNELVDNESKPVPGRALIRIGDADDLKEYIESSAPSVITWESSATPSWMRLALV